MRIVLILIILFFGSSFSPTAEVEKIYVKMESRQLQNNKTITLKSEICYEQNGNLTTHFTSPVEYVMITNKSGEIKMYDPIKNTIITKQNNLFSSQTSQFFCFLSGKQNDMGLSDLGYVPVKTYPDKSAIITEWTQKVQDKKSSVFKIKLVHVNQRPIYMDYTDKNGLPLRKVYYYNYQTFGKFSFPLTNTEIVYNSIKDSVVTKTVYSDMKINSAANSPYFNFKIPRDAKKGDE